MKKRGKCWLAAALALSLCAPVLPAPALALETPPVSSALPAQKEQEDTDGTGAPDYAAYLAELSGAPAAGEAVTVPVGGTVQGDPVRFTVQIPTDGLYTIGMSYRALGSQTGALELRLEIDGALPFAEAGKLQFPRMWQDKEENRTDGMGNEFAAEQVPYEDTYFNLAADITGRTAQPYLVYLQAGVHEAAIAPVSGEFALEYVEFGVPESLPAYQAPGPDAVLYGGEPIVMEGERPAVKSSYWLSAKADNSSAKITPNSATKSLVNYIGGANWKNTGETIVWQTPELEAGYYQLGFSFRQSTVLGDKTYRRLTIDGKTPFEEAASIGFDYAHDWQQTFFEDEDGTPYRIYLSAGRHEIGLTVVPGDNAEICELLESAVDILGALYIEITMITGETADAYRDYDLFAQIPDMEERLETVRGSLAQAEERLQELTGQGGTHASVVKSMRQVVEQMLDNRYTAHQYKSMYYDKYCALAAELNSMREMPLDIDKLVLTAPGQEAPFEKTGFFTQLWFSVEKFFASFYQDYNRISDADAAGERITVWVNWGRDQAQVLNSLAQSSFTPETGVTAEIQLVNASIVQAVLSGKGPDCILQYARSEPVNLAMRGVLTDLTRFPDLEEVLESFQPGAETPYRYRDGLYALPDTQTFFLLYYRRDILEQLGLSVPETWEDFREIAKLLARRNLSVWMPNKVATDLAQANAGVGSINLFPTLLLQKGLSLYAPDGRSTTLSDPEVVVAFGEWTDYYRKLKLPETMDFYNRFRTGTCPLGIESQTMYTTLKAAAPEIDGLWGVAPVPGTVQADGTVSHASAGGGTACAILSQAQNPDAAWEFLKWWTGAQTQLAYSNEVESLLGPTGRVAVSNVEAFMGMDWDDQMLDAMLTAWEQVEEIPEYPGSYYVSRSLYHSFWNVVDNNQNPKDMLLKYSREADAEMARKWKQYENRPSGG